jgi:hypothetical protein
MRSLLTMAAICLAVAPVIAGAGMDPAWQGWQTVAGVFDLGGPRSDGSLVVAGSASLYLVDTAGNVSPFARGVGGYHEDPGSEAYLAVSPGAHVSAAGCEFARDDTFLLRLHVPFGIERVDASGQNTGSFANVTGVTSLNGIAFDTTGAFDHRLLASGPSGGKTVISAIDCNGDVQVITKSAPVLEGGLAVAPSSFGSFGGNLIAPDELSGKIYAIAADGTVNVVAKPALPIGGDIGVESLGFVPPGFMGGGSVYYADRKTPGNPHPGTDSILRLASADLAAAGVQDGDLLVATEGGATMVAVRCAATCTVIPVVSSPTTAHGEGHIVFTRNTVPSPTPSPTPIAASAKARTPASGTNALIAILVVIALLAFAGGLMLGRRRS